ncbi:MAG: 3-isopropylmalate dehydratase large subunit [Candidatus Omnitrophota bacterium]|nr:MAG: 3-isopropylmalate dehydratase large subunit [Candidatus Omnitrophota bacterium]
MGQTITEKIFNLHIKGKKVKAGDFVYAKVDLALGNDVTAPIAIEEFEKLGINKVKDSSSIVLVPDHFTPAKDIRSAQQARALKDFALRYNVEHYYEIGRMGIEHALLPEQGLVLPGSLIIGADSHTCTYGALGAFSTGIGSTDLAACWATGCCWFKVPETIKFIYHGTRKKWVTGKDLILFTIGKVGVDGALYKAMEFSGHVIEKLPIDQRFTMANMAIEAGGKSGIIAPDRITLEYIKEHPYKGLSTKNKEKQPVLLSSDKDAEYAQVIEINVSEIEPQVAMPHLPSNTLGVSKLKKICIDQVVIGSCTNGRISDLRIAAKILKGKKIHKNVRCIIFPATQEIYLQALKEGLIEIFVKADAVVSTSTCGPCLGGHMGVLAKGERALATTNRNFVGRMGHPESEVYLSNPAVAAASAIAGQIIGPEQL